MKHITSRQNAIVARFRAVSGGDDRTQLLLDGSHLVTEAIGAGLAMTVAVVTAEAINEPEVGDLVAKLSHAGVEVVSVATQVMNVISPVRAASPIAALARRHSSTADRLFSVDTPVILCAADVQDPGNVGAIVRVAEAGGATGVAVTGVSADPLGWKALRGSMGSALRLPLAHGLATMALIDEARLHGIAVVASVPRGGVPPEEARLTGPIVLIVGAEGAGLPSVVIAAAAERITIPMAPPVESLNTAVCAALLVYEARRQRLAASAHGLAVSR
jgi:TrmH family RNA methyltransferase